MFQYKVAKSIRLDCLFNNHHSNRWSKNGPVGVAAGAASGFATSTFLELVNYDRKSQCISYITYGARAKNNARYIKQKTFTYPHKGFKPNKKHTTSYSYGLVI